MPSAHTMIIIQFRWTYKQIANNKRKKVVKHNKSMEKSQLVETVVGKKI